MSRNDLRHRSGVRLTANAAQLSLRDLRLKPLRELPELQAGAQLETELQRALKAYAESLDR